MRKFLQSIILYIAVMVVFLPRVSFAYIDPGTGSFLIQILAAAIFGASFAFRSAWRRAFNFLKKFFVKGVASVREQTVEKKEENQNG